ncbi:glycosyltransferase [Methanosarcina sp. 1.H.A.2.2]|uniref:glycosyltransferase n=1 Tax=Methanosarcina sp. 1.H.A.2.2 TaxID=1483601 RepID=UPI00138E053D|nr:glycosyltransferase [Methanosarcina sp. 1.H.A.2.2]
MTEEALEGSNGASINSEGTYKVLSSLGQCDLIEGNRFAVPDIFSSKFNSNYDLLWLRGLFSTFIVQSFKKSFTVYDINGILHEEHKLKGGNKLECMFIQKLQKHCANHADVVKVHTENMKNYFIDCGVSSDFIKVPPIIDISRYPYIQKDFFSNDTINVGYSGSVRQWQGIANIFEAAEFLKDKTNVNFSLIGPNKKDIPLNSKNIRLLNKCSHHTYVSQILPKFDLFVIPRPSNLVTETTTPIKLIEAMASGVPVIASDVGGINEYVKHNRNVFLVEPDNPEALANAILKLSENPNHAKKLSKNAREVSELTFDYNEVSKHVRRVLDNYL